jgi:hypothetical protein
MSWSVSLNPVETWADYIDPAVPLKKRKKSTNSIISFGSPPLPAISVAAIAALSVPLGKKTGKTFPARK